MRKKPKRRGPRPAFHLSAGQLVRIVMIACFCLGIVAGVAAAFAMDSLSLSAMASDTEAFLRGFQEDGGRLAIFTDGLLKHGKIVVAIWFLAFVPFGGLVTLALLFVRGMGLGFTTAFLVRWYGRAGYAYAALLCLPQNLVMVPADFLAAYGSIQFILHMLREKEKADGGQLMEYALILLLCCACAALASLVEAWLTPVLIDRIIIKFI